MMQYDIPWEDLSPIARLVAEPGGGYDAIRETLGTNPESQGPWIEVLVDSPASERPLDEDPLKLFTYRVPPELTVQPGDILSVPFGSQQLGAIAIRFTDQLPADLPLHKVKEIEDVVVSGFFARNYWQILERVADYYYTPLVRVIRAAMPPGLFARSQHRIRLTDKIPAGGKEFLKTISAQKILELLQSSGTGNYTLQYIRSKVKPGANSGLKELKKRGWVESYYEAGDRPAPKLQQAVTLIASSFPPDLSKRQREVLQVLRRRGGELWMAELLKICQTSSGVVKKLVEKGCVEIYDREALRSLAQPTQTPDSPKILNSYQQQALDAINQIDGYARVLLHGVTGSGKTEVYLQAIAPILAQGKSAIVLVPEIGLTPQLCDRFQARFGDKVVVYHSALSYGERYDTWRQMLTDTPQIAIGTRSAI
ncbi:MAG: DEAD/DEAH box helicase, partial [Chroococcales cyanobacterium]